MICAASSRYVLYIFSTFETLLCKLDYVKNVDNAITTADVVLKKLNVCLKQGTVEMLLLK